MIYFSFNSVFKFVFSQAWTKIFNVSTFFSFPRNSRRHISAHLLSNPWSSSFFSFPRYRPTRSCTNLLPFDRGLSFLLPRRCIYTHTAPRYPWRPREFMLWPPVRLPSFQPCFTYRPTPICSGDRGKPKGRLFLTDLAILFWRKRSNESGYIYI